MRMALSMIPPFYAIHEFEQSSLETWRYGPICSVRRSSLETERTKLRTMPPSHVGKKITVLTISLYVHLFSHS